MSSSLKPVLPECDRDVHSDTKNSARILTRCNAASRLGCWAMTRTQRCSPSNFSSALPEYVPSGAEFRSILQVQPTGRSGANDESGISHRITTTVDGIGEPSESEWAPQHPLPAPIDCLRAHLAATLFQLHDGR